MINRYSNIPMYSQLKNLIIEKIESGEYREDSKIPSEQEFCEVYNISRPTVRQAIAELTNNGYLYKIKGKGTFVAKSKSSIELKNYKGFTDSVLDISDLTNRNIISINIIKNSDVGSLQEIFNLQNGTRSDFAEIKYLTFKNHEVLSFNTSYLPLSLFPNVIECLNQDNISDQILAGKYPLVPAKTKTDIEVSFTDQGEAHYLQVQTGQALLKIQNILYSKSGHPVEYVIAKYRADKCKLVFENSK